MIQYTTGGVWVRTWSAVFGEIGGLATDTAGDVLVADKTHGQVQVFDKNEKHLATWSVPGVQQIAADAQGHVFLLVSVVLGWVVDVRSYAGVDEGAWSAILPGSFREVAYTPGRTTSIRELAVDATGRRLPGGHLDAEPRRRRGGLPHAAPQGPVRILGPAGKRRGGALLAHRGSDRLGMDQQRGGGGHVVLAALHQPRPAARHGGGTRRPQRLGR